VRPFATDRPNEDDFRRRAIQLGCIPGINGHGSHRSIPLSRSQCARRSFGKDSPWTERRCREAGQLMSSRETHHHTYWRGQSYDLPRGVICRAVLSSNHQRCSVLSPCMRLQSASRRQENHFSTKNNVTSFCRQCTLYIYDAIGIGARSRQVRPNARCRIVERQRRRSVHNCLCFIMYGVTILSRGIYGSNEEACENGLALPQTLDDVFTKTLPKTFDDSEGIREAYIFGICQSGSIHARANENVPERPFM
jgi:hypothetical protein